MAILRNPGPPTPADPTAGDGQRVATEALALVSDRADDDGALRGSQAGAEAVPDVPTTGGPFHRSGEGGEIHRAPIDWQPVVDALGALIRSITKKLETWWGSAIVAAYLVVPLTLSPTLVRWVEAMGADGVLRLIGALGGALAVTATGVPVVPTPGH